MRLLVIEDDKKIEEFLVQGLRQAGYTVDHAQDGITGLSLLSQYPYDLMILDLMIPKLDGFGVLREMKEQRKPCPVIILSAKRAVDDRILGLKSGGDDYLVKPFSFEELLVRIQTVLKRTNSTEHNTYLKVKDLEVNLITREVLRGDKKIELQAKEFALLELLMRNPGRVISKTFIMEKVWDYHFDPQTSVVDVLVCRLRSKIDKDFESPMIKTVRGIGYVLGQN